MSIDHKNEAHNHLHTADDQLELYYDDNSLDDNDRTICMREAEINTLISIGHTLIGILTELQGRP